MYRVITVLKHKVRVYYNEQKAEWLETYLDNCIVMASLLGYDVYVNAASYDDVNDQMSIIFSNSGKDFAVRFQYDSLIGSTQCFIYDSGNQLSINQLKKIIV